MNTKRIAAALLATCCAVLPSLGMTGCMPRTQVLKVYNWEEYLEEFDNEVDIIDDFEDWYEEFTGNPIKVILPKFDVNETMYPRISEAHVDYDVTCPSDYMIYKMRKEGLLRPVDKRLIWNAATEQKRETDVDDETVTEFFKETLNPFTFTERKDDDTPDYAGDLYSIGYMWGTVGVLYNTNRLTPDDVSSWNILFDQSNTALKNKIFMKNSVRESASTAALWHYRDELNAAYEYDREHGTETQSELVRNVINFRRIENSDVDKIDYPELLPAYKRILTEQKPFIRGYESDLGKQVFLEDANSDSTDERVYIGVAWSGDAVNTLYTELEESEGESHSLAYAIPREGSNVWFDNWVIPKYCNNYTAANLFIGYMLRTESASRNMDYIGYTTAVLPAFDEQKEYYEDGADGFFDFDGDGTLNTEELAYQQMYIDALFPSDETLLRCAPYDDLGETMTAALDIMWRSIK